MPRPVSRGPTPPGFLGQSTKWQNLVYSGPSSLGLHIAVADSQLSLQAHGFPLCAFAMLVPAWHSFTLLRRGRCWHTPDDGWGVLGGSVGYCL